MVGLAAVLIGSMTGRAMATEEPQYSVVERSGDLELRDYAGYILAETEVSGDMERASSAAFGRLFGYITGQNRSRVEIAMTAPVTQTPASEKIAMTAPVGQRQSENGWIVSFMMPASYTLETLPVPTDAEVSLRVVPAHRVASIRYAGRWSETRYLEHKAQLESWIGQAGLNVDGPAQWARYDAPYVPWFMRRNEILIPVSAN